MPAPTPRRLILALAPVLAIATAAMAQPAGPAREGPRAEAFHARHEAMRKQHQDDLRTILRLRPDQEAALAAFTAAHEPRRFKRDRPPAAAQTTPERLQEMARREEAMRAAHQERREALARFYAALSPDQQKVFDALQRLERGRHGGHGRGHRGHMMMRGGPDDMMGRGGGRAHDDD